MLLKIEPARLRRTWLRNNYLVRMPCSIYVFLRHLHVRPPYSLEQLSVIVILKPLHQNSTRELCLWLIDYSSEERQRTNSSASASFATNTPTTALDINLFPPSNASRRRQQHNQNDAVEPGRHNRNNCRSPADSFGHCGYCSFYMACIKEKGVTLAASEKELSITDEVA